ncbi:MAG: hypothetical protein AAB409_02395 [Gemmatimonadota bacterium]
MSHVLLIAMTFLAGILLGIRLVAALYAPIDLWYTIRTAWPVAVRRVVGWTGATVVVLLLLGGGWRWTFVAGMAVSLLVHVGSWMLVSRIFSGTPGPTPVVE